MKRSFLQTLKMRGLMAVERRSRVVDRLYKVFARARSDVMVALVPGAEWSMFIDAAHSDAPSLTRRDHNRMLLFWEKKALEAYFPPSPARIWVGAAGAGREMYCLARLGYHVAGLDPLASLAHAIAELVPPENLLAVDVASYEEMIAGKLLKGHRFAPYDAVVLGWLSICYLSSDQAIVDLLGQVKALCPSGPVLVSFAKPPASGPRQQLFRTALSRFAPHRQSSGDFFQVSSYGGGFIHGLTPGDLSRVAHGAGYRVVVCEHHGTFPHAVLLPMG